MQAMVMPLQRPNPMTKFRKPVVTLPSFRMPQLSSGLLASGAFVAAAGVAVLIAWGAAVLVEGISARAVKTRLLTEGITFAQVEADGLQIHLLGTAPNEAARYRVVNLVGGLIDSARIRDRMDVTPVKAVDTSHPSATHTSPLRSPTTLDASSGAETPEPCPREEQPSPR